MSVQTRADRGPTEGKLGESLQGRPQPIDPPRDLGRVPRELLPEANRRGVHEVGPADLDDFVELSHLGGKGRLQPLERRDEALGDSEQGGESDRRRNGVVR